MTLRACTASLGLPAELALNTVIKALADLRAASRQLPLGSPGATRTTANGVQAHALDADRSSAFRRARRSLQAARAKGTSSGWCDSPAVVMPSLAKVLSSRSTDCGVRHP